MHLTRGLQLPLMARRPRKRAAAATISSEDELTLRWAAKGGHKSGAASSAAPSSSSPAAGAPGAEAAEQAELEAWHELRTHCETFGLVPRLLVLEREGVTREQALRMAGQWAPADRLPRGLLAQEEADEEEAGREQHRRDGSRSGGDDGDGDEALSAASPIRICSSCTVS